MADRLLEHLSKLTRSYISDLHISISGPLIFEALYDIRPEDFSLEEWEYAIGYILGQENLHFPTTESALQYLYDYLCPLA